MDIMEQANGELHGVRFLRCICCLATTTVHIATSRNPPQELQLGDMCTFWNETDMVDLDIIGLLTYSPLVKMEHYRAPTRGAGCEGVADVAGCHGSGKFKGSSGRRGSTLGGSHWLTTKVDHLVVPVLEPLPAELVVVGPLILELILPTP